MHGSGPVPNLDYLFGERRHRAVGKHASLHKSGADDSHVAAELCVLQHQLLILWPDYRVPVGLYMFHAVEYAVAVTQQRGVVDPAHEPVTQRTQELELLADVLVC